MRQVAPQNTNVREGVSPNISASIGRGAIYLADFWEEHIRHEFEAHSVEDTLEVYWQGRRHVLGPSGYYVPDSSREHWSIGGEYKQRKEEAADAYEGFFELPPAVVLLVLWTAGVALIGLCALVLYLVGRVLVGLIAGSI